VCWCASKDCFSGRVTPLSPCYATERDHLKNLKHTATNAWCRLIAVGSLFSIFPFWITILKAKWPDFVKKANFFSGGGGLCPLAPGCQRPCTKPLKFSDNRKSYNKQFSNVVEVTPFYGIDLNSKLTDFLHLKFSVLCWAMSIHLLRKRRKRKLEAVKFWRKRKRFDKISWKRKRTRKRLTLSGDGSRKSQECGSGSKLGNMTLQEEPEAEAKIFYTVSTSL